MVTEQEAREALRSDEHLQALPGDLEEKERLDRALVHVAEESHPHIRVALVGNPNCGKTSLFNVASGAHEHVGNYSGVTVDAKEGHLHYKDYDITLVDLPGTYSLSAYSPEELYVRKHLLESMPDVVINVGGLSGAFIPVSEDSSIEEAATSGFLSMEKLEALTSVCSVGLDMIAVPGDTPAASIAGIIADEMAIGVINGKTTAVRLIPAIGKREGEMLEFGGLFGSAPVMAVNAFAGSVFAHRGGRFPAPLNSLRN